MAHNSLTHYPVDGNGNLLGWVASQGYYKPSSWVPNEPQKMRLQLRGASRGRSSAKLEWEDETGRWWEMFLSDMVKVGQQCVLVHGEVTDVWIVVKRGANYGLALHETE